MSTKPLQGQLALITGCTGGIGKATALMLADLGASIAVHYHANAAGADELVQQLEAKGVQAKPFQADMGDYDAVRKLHRDVVAAMGEPEILFNNHGITMQPKTDGLPKIEDISLEAFETTWRTNTGSSYLLTQLCVPAMEKKKYGRVVFCSSVAGLTGGVIGPHYASSKSAMHGMLHWLSGRYCKDGITVNGVAPALITDTAMLPGEPEQLKAKIPVGRLGYPSEVAEVVTMLVKNGYMTNKVIPIDGGWVAH